MLEDEVDSQEVLVVFLGEGGKGAAEVMARSADRSSERMGLASSTLRSEIRPSRWILKKMVTV